MVKFTIRSALVKAAMLFQAKQDIRYYLNGIRIEPNRIAATNGHCMWLHNFESELDIAESLTLQFKGAMPAKSFNINFEVGEKSGVAFSEDVDGKIIAATYFELIDGTYPDIDKVIAPKEDEKPTPVIGFNTEYLSLLQKATKLVGNQRYPSVVVNLRGPDAVSVFNIRGPEFNSKLFLMPVRL